MILGATTEATPFDATGNAEAYGSSPPSYAQGRDGVSEKLRARIRFEACGNLKQLWTTRDSSTAALTRLFLRQEVAVRPANLARQACSELPLRRGPKAEQYVSNDSVRKGATCSLGASATAELFT